MLPALADTARDDFGIFGQRCDFRAARLKSARSRALVYDGNYFARMPQRQRASLSASEKRRGRHLKSGVIEYGRASYYAVRAAAAIQHRRLSRPAAHGRLFRMKRRRRQRS